MFFPDTAPLLLIAIVIDAVTGDPRWFYRIVPHPTAVMGWTVAICDRAFNRGDLPKSAKRLLGLVSLLIVAGLSGMVGVLIGTALIALPQGIWVEALLVSTLISQNSLHRHVADVAGSLRDDGLEGGRHAVSQIVGRDAATLDEHGVARASIESLAENFCDGVVAPIFWGLLFGLPGILVYKAVNTADSMIGHLNDKYRDFGWAAARLDDVANHPPARISGGLIALAGAIAGRQNPAIALCLMARDGAKHRSVNAGFPEAAMAAALDLRLAGPRHYDGAEVADPWLGDGREEATPDDIRRALRVYLYACILAALPVAAVALVYFRA